MTKLYKYRPLSEFLFKELYYQELYFASYSELNDPLDLSARIEFTFEEEEHLGYLLYFLYKTNIKFDENISKIDAENNLKILAFNKNEELWLLFRKCLFEQLVLAKNNNKFIWQSQVEKCISESIKIVKLDFTFDFVSFRKELNRITGKFLANSYATCFSESNSNFLMWSHYASKHSGICLEFTLNSGMFPYVKNGQRQTDKEKYLERMSTWQTESRIFWDRIKKVIYKDEQPFINFYDFSPVFENEFDCDLIGLSKSWTHQFAFELEWVFSTKTKPWGYEKEWRAIQINFGEPLQPEKRIRHYPIESLSAIYFGIRTPEIVKKRIYKIFDGLKAEIEYYDSVQTNGKDLEFTIWENYEE